MVAKINFRECWGCSRIIHNSCIESKERLLPRGPWHCRTCSSFHQKRCTRDITLDKALLKYILLQEMPDTMAAKARVARHSKYVSIDSSGKLWLLGDKTSPK